MLVTAQKIRPYIRCLHHEFSLERGNEQVGCGVGAILVIALNDACGVGAILVIALRGFPRK